MTRHSYYKLINEFYRHKTLDEVRTLYPKVFKAIRRYNWHMPSRLIREVYSELALGNWERLWPTEAEKSHPIDDIVNDFVGEIFYCSDRMTWDRLLHIHWMWQQFIKGEDD